ncbi:MAG: amidohydrolase [Deltaproteobacteria bacterium]|nr:MAG: amidohydrolase [Deltaproteobacteria bacterium]
MAVKAIDCWVNVNMGGLGRPEYLQRVAKDYFKKGEEFFKTFSVDEILDDMNRLEIEKAVLTTDPRHPEEHVLAFAEKHPDRFALGVQLDPRRGMKALRDLQGFAKNHALVLCRITPFMIDLPPNDAVYYPVYAKCIELGLPITINTGIPGPPAPGECQYPMHLDRVCLHFPELVLVMAHGADPWWGIAARLMIKYPNLHLMTSAYSPRYLPPDFVHFMNTRGKDKVIFASDHPVLTMERAVGEARALELRPGVLEKYLYENAARVFFGGPPGGGSEPHPRRG